MELSIKVRLRMIKIFYKACNYLLLLVLNPDQKVFAIV